jgi:hypothetical protein
LISFEEGRKHLAQSGLPATAYFLLSTKDEASFAQTDTLSGGVSEITGTGYARQSQSLPTPTSANPTVLSFAQMTWATGSATDWPSAVKSAVLVTTSDNTGVAVAAFNLNGTTGRAMNAASTTENFTPTLNLQ